MTKLIILAFVSLFSFASVEAQAAPFNYPVPAMHCTAYTNHNGATEMNCY